MPPIVRYESYGRFAEFEPVRLGFQLPNFCERRPLVASSEWLSLCQKPRNQSWFSAVRLKARQTVSEEPSKRAASVYTARLCPFSSTCSGVMAPAITLAVTGFASSQPNARRAAM